MTMMLGWLRAEAERASCSNLCNASRSPALVSGRTLMATSRPSRPARARYTSPIAPEPTGERISYDPRMVPAGRGICYLALSLLAVVAHARVLGRPASRLRPPEV